MCTFQCYTFSTPELLILPGIIFDLCYSFAAVRSPQACPDDAVVEEGRSDYQNVAKEIVRVIEQPDGFDFAVGVQIPSVTQCGRAGSQDGVPMVEIKSNISAAAAADVDINDLPVSYSFKY